MQYVFGIVIFLFGAALGSFINVIANRYNTGLSFFKGRSICFSCNTQLQTRDLFPIFSFLFLKGKCRYCQSKIPKETIIFEFIMGGLSVLAAFYSGLLSATGLVTTLLDGSGLFLIMTKYLLVTAIFSSILLISVYDLRHFIIPDSFLVSLFVLSLVYNLYFTILNSLSFFLITSNFISGLILALPFFMIFLFSRGTWFGFGDVKYILVIGFFLGLVQGLSAVILAFWIGAVISITALLLKKIKPHLNLPLLQNNLTIKSEIPFGPFLSLGIIISFYLSLDLFQIHALFNIF
jgi:leader peptidase (prepilin peptidase) / N-methyltransferase